MGDLYCGEKVFFDVAVVVGLFLFFPLTIRARVSNRLSVRLPAQPLQILLHPILLARLRHLMLGWYMLKQKKKTQSRYVRVCARGRVCGGDHFSLSCSLLNMSPRLDTWNNLVLLWRL